MIIGLSGYARSGKDTVADYLVENYGFKRVAFADEIRDALLTLDPFVPNHYFLYDVVEHEGWEVAKSIPYVRQMLQNLGMWARENVDELFWVNKGMEKASWYERVVITDVRFLNEATAITNNDGVMIRVNRPSVQPINNHVSETELDNYAFKHTIDNDSDLFDLHLRIEELMRGFGLDKVDWND